MSATWGEVEAQAPDLAAAVRDRFETHRHHLLATLRADGSPRLSGTEVEFLDDEVRVGMMPGSRKLDDVRRDNRVEIHSAPLDVEMTAPDVKLHGVLVELGPIDPEDMDPSAADASSPPPSDDPAGWRFAVRLSSVSTVAVQGEELVISVWRPGAGVAVTRRH